MVVARDQTSGVIDHLVYASPDLAAASAAIATLLGVTPSPGGQHVGRGTRNELVSLGGATYLEIIGPDPDQPPPDDGRPFGVEQITEARLVAWCVRPQRPLDDLVDDARRIGVDFGEIAAMSRRRPDGVLLEWRLTFPQLDGPFGCALPFLIDWGESSHPTDRLPTGARLVELSIAHPDPATVQVALDLVGIDGVEVAAGQPSLTARIAGQVGEVTLTS
jgi:Glyoxalase-like domain